MPDFKTTSAHSDMKQLAVLIYDFLMDEHAKKDMTKCAKQQISLAMDSLEKVYRIKFCDYVFSRQQLALLDLYRIGYKPVPIQNRIQAEKHKEMGNKLMDSKVYNLAEEEFTKAVELDGRNAVYFCNRSASRVLQGSVLGAMEDCNKALELDPRYAKPYCMLGLIHAAMDRPTRALRCYRKALKLDPNNPVYLANIDKISQSLNRTSLRVLQPVYRGGRSLVRIATSPGVFKKKKGLDGVLEVEEKQRYRNNAEKLALVRLD